MFFFLLRLWASDARQGALDGNKNMGCSGLLGNGVGDSVRLSQHNKSVWPMNLFSNDTEVAKQAPPLNLV